MVSNSTEHRTQNTILFQPDLTYSSISTDDDDFAMLAFFLYLQSEKRRWYCYIEYQVAPVTILIVIMSVETSTVSTNIIHYAWDSLLSERNIMILCVVVVAVSISPLLILWYAVKYFSVLLCSSSTLTSSVNHNNIIEYI